MLARDVSKLVSHAMLTLYTCKPYRETTKSCYLQKKGINHIYNPDFELLCFVDPAVAFSAYVDENTGPSGANGTFVFDKVLTNEGGAYDESIGVFTCPISGIYVFTVVASTFKNI